MSQATREATVFLVNDTVRAIRGTFEKDAEEGYDLFKTFDPDIKVGDHVVVQKGGSWSCGFLVAKVTEVDVAIDFDSDEPEWIAAKFDTADLDSTIAQENAMLEAVKSAEFQEKRKKLAATLMANTEAMKALPLASSAAPASDQG